MAGGPDLFVVCKNCQAEVSPYITECPYCGHRLRKRAPKLEKGGTPKAPKRARRAPKPAAPPRLGRLRSGEIPGVRADSRPYVALGLILVPVVATLLAKAAVLDLSDFVLLPDADTWQAATTLFLYNSTGYEFAALGAVFLFAWLLERRHGWWAPLLVFAAGGVGGMVLVSAADSVPFAMGANGAALALLGAWVVRDLLARRAGEETESDLLGVLVIALVLIMLPAVIEEAHPLAGAFGGILGLGLGLPLARMRER